jgi:aerotaxis receptor
VVRDQGKVTGDLSIRSVPTEAQIQQAEALYARLNAGKAARSGILAWLADRNLGLRRVSAERLTLVQAMALVPSLIWVKQGPCS